MTSGIRRLMAAVLVDNARILLRCDNPRILAEELRWMLSEENREVFAFCRICAVLMLDPGRIRRSVLRQRRFPRWMLADHAA